MQPAQPQTGLWVLTLTSGDAAIIKLVKLLPEESWAKLKHIFTEDGD